MTKLSSSDFSNEDMLNALRDFYNEHGHSPKMKHFKGKSPSSDMISKRFGTWNNAIRASGLEIAKRHNEYSDEYLLNCLTEYYNKNNKIPTIRGMLKEGYPTPHAYIKHFGSFKNALIKTRLYELREDKHQFCDTFTDDELLESLRNYMKDKDRIPVHSIMRSELINPSISTFERRYYSIFNALKMIGYDYEKQNKDDGIKIKLEMLDKYKSIKKELGKVPSSRDIENYSRNGDGSYYSMSTYETHFGSLYELQVLCGFTPTVIGRNKSKKDLTEDLVWLSTELNRTPSQNDLVFFDNVASIKKYIDVFGSWNNALQSAGLKLNSDVCYSSKGEKCLSYYELLFTNMLEEYNIQFTKENKYKEFIPTSRKYRFDFVLMLNKKQYFIEVFGITCREDYKVRTENKVELCKEHNLPLIEIYPENYTSNKLNELHKMLMDKIEILDAG